MPPQPTGMGAPARPQAGGNRVALANALDPRATARIMAMRQPNRGQQAAMATGNTGGLGPTPSFNQGAAPAPMANPNLAQYAPLPAPAVPGAPIQPIASSNQPRPMSAGLPPGATGVPLPPFQDYAGPMPDWWQPGMSPTGGPGQTPLPPPTPRPMQPGMPGPPTGGLPVPMDPRLAGAPLRPTQGNPAARYGR